MARLALSAPWVEFYHEIEAFFKEDPEVHIVYDEEAAKISLHVDSAAKAVALDQIIVHEKTFGNISVTVSVIPANGLCSTLYQEIAKDIFEDREGVFFCTDTPAEDGGSLGKPLGEWP